MAKDIKTIIGEKIKKLREEKNITQKELSYHVNTSKESISQYERGVQSPKPETLIMLANYFNVSIDYILGRVDIKNSFIIDNYKKENLDEETINKIIEILKTIK